MVTKRLGIVIEDLVRNGDSYMLLYRILKMTDEIVLWSETKGEGVTGKEVDGDGGGHV